MIGKIMLGVIVFILFVIWFNDDNNGPRSGPGYSGT